MVASLLVFLVHAGHNELKCSGVHQLLPCLAHASCRTPQAQAFEHALVGGRAYLEVNVIEFGALLKT